MSEAACLQLQLQELEMLALLLPDDAVSLLNGVIEEPLDELVERLRNFEEGRLAQRPLVAVRVILVRDAAAAVRSTIDRENEDVPEVVVRDVPFHFSLDLQLPRQYPMELPPEWVIDAPKLPREQRNEVLRIMNETIAEAPKDSIGCLQLLLENTRNAVLEIRRHFAEEETALFVEKAAEERERLCAWENALLQEHVIGRRCVYYHHILGVGKRQCISHWAKALKLHGWCKIGYPGILIVEGPECGLVEYVRLLQRLRWKLMVVRGEEREDISRGSRQGSLCLDGFRKIKQAGVVEMIDSSDIATRCREAGLEQLFLTSMKIYTAAT